MFVVDQKLFWTNANEIEKHDPIVDNDQTFEHHYKWANPPYNHHQLKRRRRFTLKADPNQSFQPQNKDRQLINILPFLNANGIATQELIRAMTSKRGSRPFKLDNN
ncbi:MAG: hypothetical protein ISS80_03345, partial [Candidatus Cloacimonetes bacterium]|nr:hypothetical protein [Candidatus Cloacimonadota bacterium]